MKPFCKKLSKCTCEPDFKKQIKGASNDDLEQLVDYTTDILKKKIPINKKQQKVVAENRWKLRHFVHRNFSLVSKKRYLQRGGGLGAIFASILRGVRGATRVAGAGGAAA